MEWSERMNAAIGYIEDNLAGEIDQAEAARCACCSVFHFQRIFMVVIGITPAEYARRRRLTLAARDLTNGARVLDVALKYGYDSADAFSRAFRNVHGITPRAARTPGVKLTAFPRISFNIELKGGNDMDYRIRETPSFEIIGRGRQFTPQGGENFVKIPRFWQDYMKTREYADLMDLNGGQPGLITGGACLGCCLPNEDDGWDPFTYAIAVEKPADCRDTRFDTYAIPPTTWAIFDATLDDLQDVTKRIYSEFFPSTGYEHDLKPDLEVYFPENPATRVMAVQLWIPVTGKKA